MSVLTDVEANIVRYTAGYVTRTIKQRCEKMDTKEAPEIVNIYLKWLLKDQEQAFMITQKSGLRKLTRLWWIEVNESMYQSNRQGANFRYFTYDDVMWESTRAQKMEAVEMVTHVESLVPNVLKY